MSSSNLRAPSVDLDLQPKLIWLMAIRMLVLVSMLFQGLVGVNEQTLEEFFDAFFGRESASVPENLAALQVLVGTVSIQTLLYALLLRPLRRRPVAHAYLQLVGDLFLVTLLIYRFGQSLANLSVLYLVVIGVGTVLLHRRAGLILAAVATAFFGAVTLAHQSGEYRDLWQRPDKEVEDAAAPGLLRRTFLWLEPPAIEDTSGVPLQYTLPIHFAGFLAVAFFASYLARDRRTLERKLAERSSDLARLRELYRDVVQSISSGLVVTDLDGVITSVNQAGIAILAVDENTLVGTPVAETLLFGDSEWRRLTRRASEATLREELELERGGRNVLLGFTLSQLRDGEGRHRGFILIFQDLTEWRRLQEEVRIQDRMAALGKMAAGLAHEIGNPLASLSGSVQMLSRHVDDPGQAKLLGITLRESQRLDRTLKAFLQFAKPRDRHLETIDVAELLAEDVHLLRASDELLGTHEIVLDLEPESATLKADVDQLGQLFWNLARNALQAMPEGGRLRVVGRLLDDAYRIQFHDTGRGMSEEERAEVFQPFKSFFDDGTGLGMAIVYRIVEEHGGHVEVDSRPGGGTTITVDLPLEPPVEPSDFEPYATPGPPESSEETV